MRSACSANEPNAGAASTELVGVRLVRRLDGPLASRCGGAADVLAEQILEQLEAGGSVRAAPPSWTGAPRVAEDTIDWSYRLLDDDERALLVRLSAFNGSFDLPAVIAVADVVPIRAADLLARLVDKSLVQSSVGRAGRRLRLLDTVRRFAAARLAAEDAAIVRDRHARHFADQIAMLGAAVPGAGEDHALAQLAVELDDIAAAVAHAAEVRDIETVARLVDGPRLSLSAEGARWAHLALRAVDLPNLDRDPRYVSILASAAWAVLRGDLTRACARTDRHPSRRRPVTAPRLC
jgi:hypothetical protein